MSSNTIPAYYWVLIFLGVLAPAGFFLFIGNSAAVAVTPQNQSHVEAVMAGLLTVDGLLLGLTTRFREAFGRIDRDHRRANAIESLQVAVLMISLMWPLIAMLYAGFSTDISLVSIWFKSSLNTFFIAVTIYASFAILSRGMESP